MTLYIYEGIVYATSVYGCARFINLPNPSEIALLMTVHSLFALVITGFSERLEKEIDEHKTHQKKLLEITKLAIGIGSFPAIFWLAKKMEISTPNTKTYIGICLGSAVLSYVSGDVLSVLFR